MLPPVEDGLVLSGRSHGMYPRPTTLRNQTQSNAVSVQSAPGMANCIDFGAARERVSSALRVRCAVLNYGTAHGLGLLSCAFFPGGDRY
eukprot:448088-Rhodomonas_salina.4